MAQGHDRTQQRASTSWHWRCCINGVSKCSGNVDCVYFRNWWTACTASTRSTTTTAVCSVSGAPSRRRWPTVSRPPDTTWTCKSCDDVCKSCDDVMLASLHPRLGQLSESIRSQSDGVANYCSVLSDSGRMVD